MYSLNKLLMGCVLLFMVSGCSQEHVPFTDIVHRTLDFAAVQYGLMLDAIDTQQEIKQPRSIDENGNLRLVSGGDWTVGFFPGALWYIYEHTNNEHFKEKAIVFTEALEELQYFKVHHDVGFMINSSYGNAYRLTGNEMYKPVLIQAAQSLNTRFRQEIGSIQSWASSKKWQCPVIVDNMMNLEILFKATQLSGDSTFFKNAVTHAETTLKNHYRPDFSCYHVVDYDTLSGEILAKETRQGYADESTWARGQAWGLYGFVMAYRYTQREDFLRFAERIAGFLLNHPNLPDDKIPYWDYDAPDIPDEPRDASAAAIMASALYELSLYSSSGEAYRESADTILKSLTSEKYLARKGENLNFLLQHCVGAKPLNKEVDVPLNYADYYFLEALTRAKDILNNS